jgi:hypothetical protein
MFALDNFIKTIKLVAFLVYKLPKFILAVLAEQDLTFGCSYMEKVPNIVMFIMSLVSCVST